MSDVRAVLLCDDLLFGSNILGQARHRHIDMRQARTPATLVEQAAQQRPALAILDLHLAGPQIVEVVKELRAAGVRTIVGYGSHVDVATLKAARDAGCDLVMPRSQFVKDLPAQLEDWCAGAQGD